MPVLTDRRTGTVEHFDDPAGYGTVLDGDGASLVLPLHPDRRRHPHDRRGHRGHLPAGRRPDGLGSPRPAPTRLSPRRAPSRRSRFASSTGPVGSGAFGLAAGDLDERQADLGEGVLERVLVVAEAALQRRRRGRRRRRWPPAPRRAGVAGRTGGWRPARSSPWRGWPRPRRRAPTPAGRGPAASPPRSAGPRPPARGSGEVRRRRRGPARGPGRCPPHSIRPGRRDARRPVSTELIGSCSPACSGSGSGGSATAVLRNHRASLVPYVTQQPGKAGLTPPPGHAPSASGSMHRQRVPAVRTSAFRRPLRRFRPGDRTGPDRGAFVPTTAPPPRRTCAYMRSDRP